MQADVTGTRVRTLQDHLQITNTDIKPLALQEEKLRDKEKGGNFFFNVYSYLRKKDSLKQTL